MMMMMMTRIRIKLCTTALLRSNNLDSIYYLHKEYRACKAECPIKKIFLNLSWEYDYTLFIALLK